MIQHSWLQECFGQQNPSLTIGNQTSKETQKGKEELAFQASHLKAGNFHVRKLFLWERHERGDCWRTEEIIEQ